MISRETRLFGSAHKQASDEITTLLNVCIFFQLKTSRMCASTMKLARDLSRSQTSDCSSKAMLRFGLTYSFNPNHVGYKRVSTASDSAKLTFDI